MQLLVPPLEDASSCRGDYGSKQPGDVSTSNSRSRSVMSQGLQDRFGAMEQAWNQSNTKRSVAASSASPNEAEDSAQDPETNGEDSSHRNKKLKIAMETAFAIESEVQKWQRGIAELEAMLEEASGEVEDALRSSSSSSSSSFGGEGGQGRARPPEVVRFPSLPPMIPAEEGDLDGSNQEEEEDDEDEHYSSNDEGSDDEE